MLLPNYVEEASSETYRKEEEAFHKHRPIFHQTLLLQFIRFIHYSLFFLSFTFLKCIFSAVFLYRLLASFLCLIIHLSFFSFIVHISFGVLRSLFNLQSVTCSRFLIFTDGHIFAAFTFTNATLLLWQSARPNIVRLSSLCLHR